MIHNQLIEMVKLFTESRRLTDLEMIIGKCQNQEESIDQQSSKVTNND